MEPIHGEVPGPKAILNDSGGGTVVAFPHPSKSKVGSNLSLSFTWKRKRRRGRRKREKEEEVECRNLLNSLSIPSIQLWIKNDEPQSGPHQVLLTLQYDAVINKVHTGEPHS